MVELEVKGLDELGELFESIQEFNLAGESHKVARALAYYSKNEWISLLTNRHREVGLKNPQWGYARGIRIHSLGQSHFEVISDSKYNDWMAKQESDFDMKKTHPYGKKSRVAQDKTPYLIVPFMHLRPNKANTGMPQSIYSDLKKITKSKGKSTILDPKSKSKTSKNFRGEDVFRASYRWGGRLGSYDGELSKYSGMVDFDRSYIDRKGLKISDSKAFTFRVISAKSPAGSWIRKARPVILPEVEKRIKGKIEGIVENVLFK